MIPALTPRIRRKHLRKYSWLPDVLRIKGSIVVRVFGPVLTVTLFAVAVCYAWSRGRDVKLTSSVVPLLSIVVGLILVFRNGTSYDRYWEGRKSFATLCSNVRNLSRMIWVNVALPPTGTQPPHAKGKTPTTNISEHALRRRKIDALRLALSFAYALKHYLRGEDGTHWEDYADVLPASILGENPRKDTSGYSATRDKSKSSSNDSSNSAPDATKRVKVKRSKQNLSAPNVPLLTNRTVDFPFADQMSMPFPLIIAHELSMLIFEFRREGLLETVGPAGANAMAQLVQSMVDQLTAMERVANTPIPISYGIHLKQCVTLYLFILPFTMVNDLGWSTIPLVTVIAFTFMGIEGIADEIEMPFGTDLCDIPLDRYCQDLKEEINYTIYRLPDSNEGSHGYDDGEGDD